MYCTAIKIILRIFNFDEKKRKKKFIKIYNFLIIKILNLNKTKLNYSFALHIHLFGLQQILIYNSNCKSLIHLFQLL